MGGDGTGATSSRSELEILGFNLAILRTHSDSRRPADDGSSILDLTGLIDKDEYLGCGTFGDVYKGRWINLENQEGLPAFIAVKVMKLASRGSEKDKIKRLRMLRRELTVWQRLSHPNVLPLIGVAEISNGFTSLISVWMGNGTVKDYIKEHPAKDRSGLLLGVAHGLEYLHSFEPEISHGDLKGDNILIDDRGNPRLCDFGLSRMMEDNTLWNTSATSAGGTTRWKSPELMTAEQATVIPASDVYAYGMTSLEIMTGRHPFSEYRTDAAVLTAVVLHAKRPKRDLLETMYDPLWSLWERCWNQNPNLRPSMRLVVSQMQNIAADLQLISASRAFHKSRAADYDFFGLWNLLQAHCCHGMIFPIVIFTPPPLDWSNLIALDGEGLALHGSSVSYLGKWINLPDKVVPPPLVEIKVAPPKITLLEAHIRRQLQHDNIVPMVGVMRRDPCGDIDSLITLRMPHGTVQSYLSGKSLSERLPFLVRMARALAYMHGLDPPVVHGHVKPDHYLVDDDGYPRLTEFQYGRIIGDRTWAMLALNASQAITVDSWTAPELRLWRVHMVSPATDVYSLGITLHVVASDTMPLFKPGSWFFGGRSRIETSLPEDLSNVVEACCAYDPKSRPSTSEVVRLLAGIAEKSTWVNG